MNNEKIDNRLALIYDNQYRYNEAWTPIELTALNEAPRMGNNYFYNNYCHVRHVFTSLLDDYYEYNEKRNSYFGKHISQITWLDIKKHLRKKGVLMLAYYAPENRALDYIAPADGPKQLKYNIMDDDSLANLDLYGEPSSTTILFFNREAYKEVTGLNNFTKKGVDDITRFYADDLAMSLFMTAFGDSIEYDEDKDKYVYNEEYTVTKYKQIEVKGI